MAEIKDVLLDETNDLQIENGDFVAGESTAQHFDLLLLTNKGEWKQNPLVGVGLRLFLNGSFDSLQQAALQRELQVQLEGDGCEIATLNVNATAEINLDATYKASE